SIWLIVFAAAVAIWEMSGVVRACMGAIARIYGAEEDRSWKIRFPLSIGIGLVLTGSIVGALLLGTAAAGAVQGAWAAPFGVLRWGLTVVLLGVGFGVLVRFGPVDARTTRWASGGATLVVAACVAESLVFGVYLQYVADYTTAAGSLLGVYFLTSFIYVAAIIL